MGHSRLIVVIGAETRQGHSVIKALLTSPEQWRIRAIVTDSILFSSEV